MAATKVDGDPAMCELRPLPWDKQKGRRKKPSLLAWVAAREAPLRGPRQTSASSCCSTWRRAWRATTAPRSPTSRAARCRGNLPAAFTGHRHRAGPHGDPPWHPQLVYRVKCPEWARPPVSASTWAPRRAEVRPPVPWRGERVRPAGTLAMATPRRAVPSLATSNVPTCYRAGQPALPREVRAQRRRRAGDGGCDDDAGGDGGGSGDGGSGDDGGGDGDNDDNDDADDGDDAADAGVPCGSLSSPPRPAGARAVVALVALVALPCRAAAARRATRRGPSAGGPRLRSTSSPPPTPSSWPSRAGSALRAARRTCSLRRGAWCAMPPPSRPPTRRYSSRCWRPPRASCAPPSATASKRRSCSPASTGRLGSPSTGCICTSSTPRCARSPPSPPSPPVAVTAMPPRSTPSRVTRARLSVGSRAQARQANVVKWVHSEDNTTIFRDGRLLLAQLRARAQHACPPSAPRRASPPPGRSPPDASTPAASASAGHNPRKRVAVPAAAAGGAAAAAAAAVGAAEGKARKTTHQE